MKPIEIKFGRFTRRQRITGMFAVMALIYLITGNTTAHAQSIANAIDSMTDETMPPVCRLGTNVNLDDGAPNIDVLNTSPLRLGWYVDYHAAIDPARPQGISYAPMIRLHQTGTDSYYSSPSGEALEDAVLAHAGQGVNWFVGNEPDRRDYQDDIEPQVYAKAYHELRAQIKAIDPTAKVIAGSIVQATELRLKYLDMILERHQQQYGEPMAVDGWAIHGFILNEVSCTNNPLGIQCWGADVPPGLNDSYGLVIDVQDSDNFDIFKANIVRMRQWMADNGYRNTPLHLSEYGVLMPSGRFVPDFSPARVSEFMTKSFDYVFNDGVDETIGYPQDGNRLVQHLSWYSTSDSVFFNGYLYERDNDNRLSPMGENYALEAAKINNDFDFSPQSIAVEPQVLILEQGEDRYASVVVSLNVANAGNNHYPQAVPVELYDGNPASGGQALGRGMAYVVGCGEEATVQIIIRLPWDGISLDDLPQDLAVFAQVNPDNTIVEVGAGEDNNTISTVLSLAGLPTVTIALDMATFIPVIQR